MVVKLAEFYLSGSSGHVINWYGASYTFVISLGGDGAPFEKDDSSCAWLISFLNIERGVLSSNENYLLFRVNCSENCIPAQWFINLLLADIYSIEKEPMSCTHDGKQASVRFSFGELLNNMKMLGFLAGELSNSTKYFSSFADVSSDNANNIHGKFGREAKNTWKPWKYSDRMKVLKSVEQLKNKISTKKLSETTKQSKVTSFIAKNKSRQEFEPLLGKIVDPVHEDPFALMCTGIVE